MLHHAHTLRVSLLTLVALVLSLLSPLVAQAATLDTEEQAFVTLINNYRQQNGLPPLKISDKIDTAASWMSTDMATKNYFSHTDSLGRDPFQRMAAFGYTYNTAKGENIAAGYATASQTFTQWKNSAGHNANMLNASFKVMGIARAYAANSTYHWYWTNDFGGYDDGGTVTPSPTPSDTTAPSVSLTAPAAGATMAGTVTLSATASDNVGVKQVEFLVSGGPTLTDTTAPYAVSLNTATLANGTHTITATARDAAGNTAKQSIAITVANATVQKPGAPTNLRVAPQTTGAQVSWTPATTGGTPTAYEVQTLIYQNGGYKYATTNVAAPATSMRLTVTVTGSYYVRVRAVNAAGASSYTGWVLARIIAG